MTTLQLHPLVSLDHRFWIQRARALECQSQTLPRWIRPAVKRLAIEVRENVNSLRTVGPSCPIPPSLLSWGPTVACLFLVQPRLGVAAVRLFIACHALRLEPYRAIGDGVAFVFGAAVMFALVGGGK